MGEPPAHDPPSPPAAPSTAPRFVSVIIPTLNRGAILVPLLRSLLTQPHPHFEIIVVDQTVPPHPAVLEFVKSCADPRLRYVPITVRGLPHARNVGLPLARGEIILFADDDIIPSPDLIGAHAANYDDAKVGGVVGRILERGVDPPDEPEAVGRMSRYFFMGQEGFHARRRHIVDHVQGCNMSFRRSALDQIGGFDERYGGTAHLEDADVSWSLRERGWSLVFDPRAEVNHMKNPAGGCRPRNRRALVYWYCHNYVLFFLKHGTPWLLPAFLLLRTLRAALFALEGGDPFILAAGLGGELKALGTLRQPPRFWAESGKYSAIRPS